MKRLPEVMMIVCAVMLANGCAMSRYAANSEYPPVTSPYSPKGSLREIFYRSSEKGMSSRRAFVYLPDGYDAGTERYPVLYLLHGARGNECVWINKADVLCRIDSLVSAGAMLPTIVVFPNVNQYNGVADYGKSRLKGAMESFYEVDGTVESRFVSDVVHQTDSIFRTVPDKEHRAVAGLSIGAMQSIHLSANFPDTFAYVGAFSPMVHSFLKPGPDNSFYRHLSVKQRKQFSNPPEAYMLMIGKKDFFYPIIRKWDRKLDRKGYPHEFHVSQGGHEWLNWSEFCTEFLQRLWKEEQ